LAFHFRKVFPRPDQPFCAYQQVFQEPLLE